MADEPAGGVTIAELAGRLAAVEQELSVLRDIQAVRTLQFKYGYYMDKGCYDEVVDLFAHDGALHFMGGIFRGRAGLKRLYCDRLRTNFTDGNNGPVYGMLAEHMQLQDIVDISPDGKSAKGRFRALMQAGSHVTREKRNPYLPLQWWEAGVYENDYVKEDGVWKIQTLDYHMFWQADFESGWANSKPYEGHFFAKTFPEDPGGPDELSDRVPAFWPETPIVPFHYPHPVTGEAHTIRLSDGLKPTK